MAYYYMKEEIKNIDRELLNFIIIEEKANCPDLIYIFFELTFAMTGRAIEVPSRYFLS